MPRGRPRTAPKKRRFGNLTQLPSGRWRARYRDRRSGEVVTQTFDGCEEADNWLVAQQSAIATGSYVNPMRAKTKFSVIADLWKESALAGKKNTVNGYVGVLDSRVLPYWKNWPIGDITPLDIKKWIKDQEPETRRGTRNNRRTVLSLVLQAAVDGRYILQNPCEGIGAGQADDQPFEAVFLTRSEVTEVAAAVRRIMLNEIGRDEGYDVAVLIAGVAGLRAGEVWALRTKSIDITQGVIRVTRSRSNGQETLPKTHQRRAAPLPYDIVPRLQEFIEAAERQPEDRLFQTQRGFPIHHSNWSRDFYRPARASVGLKELPRFHDLRHTCATLWFDAGATAEIVARVLGDSVATVRAHYEHVYPDAFYKFAIDVNAVVANATRAVNGNDESPSSHVAEVISLMSAPPNPD